jgi:hypothetical protein
MSSNIYTVRVYVHQYLSWDTRCFLKNELIDKRPTKDGVRKSDIESDNGQSLLKGNRLRHSIYNTSKAWTPEK